MAELPPRDARIEHVDVKLNVSEDGLLVTLASQVHSVGQPQQDQPGDARTEDGPAVPAALDPVDHSIEISASQESSFVCEDSSAVDATADAPFSPGHTPAAQGCPTALSDHDDSSSDAPESAEHRTTPPNLSQDRYIMDNSVTSIPIADATPQHTSRTSPPSLPISITFLDDDIDQAEPHTQAVAFLQERLESKTAELLEVREQMRRMRQSRMASTDGPPEAADTVTISSSELAAMKKDLQEQEQLLAAYGDTNREAMQKIKALEAQLKEKDADMARERQAFERELVRTVESQQHRSADKADKLRRVLELEAQVAHVQEQAAAQEQELRQALETARAEKRALQAAADGSDRKALQEGDELLSKVREEMATVKAQYEAHVGGLQEKLDWHVQQQRDVAAAQALLDTQAATIADLQRRVQAAGGPAAAGGLADEQEENAQELRAELDRQKAQVAEVEGADRKRCRLLQQCAALGEEEARGGDSGKAEAAQKEVESLRHRVETLQAILLAERSSRRTGPGEATSPALDDLTNTPRPSEDGTPGSTPGGVRSSQGLTKQWVRLRQQLAEARQTALAKDSLIAKLHQQLKDGQRDRDAGVHLPQGALGSLQKQLQELRAEMTQQRQEQVDLQAEVLAAHDSRHKAEQDCVVAVRRAESEAAQLRTQVAQHKARLESSQEMVAAVQQASSAAAAALQEVRSQHTAEIKRLAASHEAAAAAAAREAAAVEAQKSSERSLQLERQLNSATLKAEALEQELQELRHNKVWAPSARELVALENQIREMSLQLNNQRQWWLTAASPQPTVLHGGLLPSPGKENPPAVTLTSPPGKGAAAGAALPCLDRFSPPGVPALSPEAVARAQALIADSATDTKTKIEFLQKQVESVIGLAKNLQAAQEQSG